MLLEHGFVINLDTRTDRWQRMGAQLERFTLTNFERFSAVSAHSLNIESLPINFVKTISAKLKKDIEKQNAEHCVNAAWGCLQSHIGVIKNAQNHGLDAVVILEDDCELEPYFHKVMSEVEEQLQTLSWDILYLGGNLHRKSKVSKVTNNLLKSQGITLTHAMIINKTAYQTILDEAPISGLSIDDYYRKVLQPKVNCFLVNPQVAYQFYTDVSDISLSKKVFKTNWSTFKRLALRKANRIIQAIMH